MKKVTSLSKDSVWYDDRSNIVGEIFRVEGQRYYPESEKAKELARLNGRDYFVFVGTVQYVGLAEEKAA